MNTMTARALMVGLLIALWAWVASVARLHVAMWAGVVALGCFFAAGGGVPGLQKTVVATLAGVLWVLVSHAVRVAIGNLEILWQCNPARERCVDIPGDSLAGVQVQRGAAGYVHADWQHTAWQATQRACNAIDNLEECRDILRSGVWVRLDGRGGHRGVPKNAWVVADCVLATD